LKEQAARRAVAFVESGMVVGLGTGSTATFALEALAERVGRGERFLGIATSEKTEAMARRLGIWLTTLEDHPDIDVTIDGADEVDPAGNLIKGLGGALLREKIVAAATRRRIIAVDGSKLVERLGTRAPVPVEVVPFGWIRCRTALQAMGAVVDLRRREASPFVTDSGHYILDSHFGPLEDPHRLAAAIKAIVGVVEHGLFVEMAHVVVTATEEGTAVKVFERPGRARPTCRP
jgi:ribose 5-phosphate isomerase A